MNKLAANYLSLTEDETMQVMSIISDMLEYYDSIQRADISERPQLSNKHNLWLRQVCQNLNNNMLQVIYDETNQYYKQHSRTS